ncbi:unnamed protein product, partial [Darwinula stevensoni]
MDGNRLSKLPSVIIKNLKKLKEFECEDCGLGPTLSTGQLGFASPALMKVDLQNNEISKVEPGAITGDSGLLKSRECFRDLIGIVQDIMALASNVVNWSTCNLNAKQFRMMNNENVTELNGSFFGALSFESIFVNHTAVKTVSPSAILPLRDQIEKLEISFSQLEEFPFHSLLNFSRLSDLRLERNSLTLVSAIQSKSLEILSLGFNKIRNLEEGWATPNLRKINLTENPLEKIPAALVKSMTNLKEFHCVACKLGPTLRSGMWAFDSKGLLTVDLQGNEISKIERLAITGLMPETELILDGNQITELPKEVFRPLLMNESHAKGFISLQGNPIECNCRLVWFINDPHLLGSVRGTCEDGTEFANLTLQCRLCDHQCVKREEAGQCIPGSNSSSNVDDCQPEEIC